LFNGILHTPTAALRYITSRQIKPENMYGECERNGTDMVVTYFNALL